jgi:hypothetical protein
MFDRATLYSTTDSKVHVLCLVVSLPLLLTSIIYNLYFLAPYVTRTIFVLLL